jgi:hypothetical protein
MLATTEAAGYLPPPSGLDHLGQKSLHTTRKFGLTQRAEWLEQRSRLREDLVDFRVDCCELQQSASVPQLLLQIRRPLAARFRIGKIAYCMRPRRFEKRLDLLKIRLGKAVERVDAPAA